MRKQTRKRGNKIDHSVATEMIKLITALIGLMTAILKLTNMD